MISILEKIVKSKNKQNFIIKGGFLLSNMMSLNERTTQDIDCLIKGINFVKENILKIISDVLRYDFTDFIEYEIKEITEIKKRDKYNGFRVKILCKLEKLEEIVKIDLAIGDVITPSEIKYNFKNIFSNSSFEIQAYNLETILAEKIFIINNLNIQSTRIKDLYDIFLIYSLKEFEIDYNILKCACLNTFKKRNTVFNIDLILNLLNEINQLDIFKLLWNNYKQKYFYAQKIEFEILVESVIKLLEKLKSS
ncbi:nucleotidyl transferase AbiEii/AbiGii toxin family protein [Mycoplasma mycoides]|uniref:Abortive infection protein AbiGII n=1 Tax=Mycoplasma mycoides subsp. capri TaxID=40477 RepID=A0AB38GDB1_MYCMC|nr:nucleotidyl transferase AbiEii/AbiGii toxin family protein [Mycoplasma mycoides]ADH22098.1 abortive infection protein AbiGII [synthetic Mycoplasma mycoides JCVI-syn1.0]ACU78838.1 abortive infection protein AbiGII [Mycoplasma mycoides subsp. capri str. GM12]ACU79670.1 abortive infection protein AbiGII [Mycoplasma mycoides subsp. capri str. GM12]SRX58453.1 abortive infection protein AbiGII [Mycoplasma mycoides subsp. capri]SRX60967.1 abortive infection protein AbiGII [Mycoplasma mycoides subs